MNIKAIFWNEEELRIRAGWRITIQLLTFAIVANILGLIDNLLLDFLPVNPVEQGGTILITIDIFIATVFSIWFVGKFIDKRQFKDFGFHLNSEWWQDFVFGFALGIILMSLVFVTELSLGWISITENTYSGSGDFSFGFIIIFAFITFICVGAYEELQVRGYLFKNLSEGFNFRNSTQVRAIYIALIITSLMFGFAHAANPNASLISSLSLVFAGILLAAGYILRGNLAIPIGLHISWNYFQGNVFGFPVSGTYAGASIITIQQGGPEVWTGGNFGPEAGLIGIIAIIIGIFLTLLWVKVRYKQILFKNEIANYIKPIKEEADLTNSSN